MERLYAPWRFEYVTEEKIDGCVFCHILQDKESDEKLGVVFRDENCYVVMNKYPYSPGHLMIIPNVHTDKIEDLDDGDWVDISLRVKQATKMVKDLLNAEGVNIGMNLSKAAGAGIAEHVHYHVVPRWLGDTNFITSIGNTRIYPVDFDKIYRTLKDNSLKYFI
ncbi:MAG: HIT domain-containing protein [Arcobacter sp.]|nr:HIT domain-containing protein [Arcobacter sp.]